MKRVFDFLVSLVGLFLLIPLLGLLSLLIKFTSKGTIFFFQERVGENGVFFKMIKFRSMQMIQDSDSTISVKGDMRVTKVGSFLRRYKLDELPELWNVLVGDMSLVGPRPDVPGYADFLKGEDRNILKLKPGITGPASLKYANEEEILSRQENPKEYNDEIIYPDKVRINLDYYYQSNLWIDIKIIFATIFRNSY
ncbi:sugar transferase [Flavobacteriales bacterium]|jgi:lipopolysaccharide/colanic/teichoic acid biosynthesis glycosyltransferase|nr:sugar transferase [Flavobacteriales bacterium]